MKRRVLTALLLIPPVVLVFGFASPWPIFVLTALAAMACCLELRSLAPKQSSEPLVMGLLMVFFAGLSLSQPPVERQLVTMGIATAFGAWAAAKRWQMWAALWCATPLLALPQLHRLLAYDSFSLAHATLLVLLPIWAGDTAAIFVGKAFGKHKLAPSISPSKTWEGTVANLIACLAAAWLLAPVFSVGKAAALVVGLSCGVLGQLGDLFESWLKRRADVKDSGSILPGHGGLLDRLDSLLFAAIPSCAAIHWLR